MIHHRYKIAIYLMAFITVCDQLTKWWVVNKSTAFPGHPVEVTSYFNIVIAHNKGITFGLLQHVRHEWLTYGLIAVVAVILVLLGRWLWLTSSTPVAVGLGMIMGGALGNAIDRIAHGAVIDFLDFHVSNYHWYAFNVADSAICIGVGLLMLDSVIRAR